MAKWFCLWIHAKMFIHRILQKIDIHNEALYFHLRKELFSKLQNMYLSPRPRCINLTINFFSMATIMATIHHNQSASRILWKLPLKSNMPLMVRFMQRGPAYTISIFAKVKKLIDQHRNILHLQIQIVNMFEWCVYLQRIFSQSPGLYEERRRVRSKPKFPGFLQLLHPGDARTVSAPPARKK